MEWPLAREGGVHVPFGALQSTKDSSSIIFFELVAGQRAQPLCSVISNRTSTHSINRPSEPAVGLPLLGPDRNFFRPHIPPTHHTLSVHRHRTDSSPLDPSEENGHKFHRPSRNASNYAQLFDAIRVRLRRCRLHADSCSSRSLVFYTNSGLSRLARHRRDHNQRRGQHSSESRSIRDVRLVAKRTRQ